MESTFIKWYPYPDLDTLYDVEDVFIGHEGFVFTLVPDGMRKEELEGQKILLSWPSIISYQISEELYREDCWIPSPESGWSFFQSRKSAYLEQFREKSAFFPEDAIHFLLVGTNLIADILSSYFPTVTVISKEEKPGARHHKEIELHGCVEIPMAMPADRFSKYFLDFVETHHWSFGGGMRTLIDGHEIDEDGWEEGEEME